MAQGPAGARSADVVGQDEIVCRFTRGPITIDGDVKEEAWAAAVPVDGFVIPKTHAKPMTQTKLRLLWDRDHLFFAAELEDHDLQGEITEHDGMTWFDDVFEIFLKPAADAEPYYELQVNAAGTKMDMFLPQRKGGAFEEFKGANSFRWETAVRRSGTLAPRTDRDAGWVVEGKIPWGDFMPTGGRPDINDRWQAAFCRYDYTLGKSPELSSTARLTEVNFHRYEDYSTLRFAPPAEGDAGLKDLLSRPTYVRHRIHGAPEPPLPYVAVRAFPELKLNFPIDVKAQPGTRLLVIIEEDGKYGPTKIVRTTTDDPHDVAPLIDPKGVAYSLHFHPKFSENGWLYVGVNGKEGDGPNMSRVLRYEISRQPPYPVVGEPLTIIEWESNGHNGAAITFGLDGMMYVTTGDGTSDSDTNNVGQDLTKPLAKVLRIDVDHPDPGKTYSVPKDNPFVDIAGARPETWAYGLRNPWRITTDPKTGQIWVGNNGQDLWEQIYLLRRGANYGWSVYEGSHPFYLNRQLGPTPHVPPTAEHPHSEARSLTGGVVYHGEKLPELRGVYIYADHSTGKMWGLRHDGNQVVWNREIADTPFFITAVSLDADGELLIADHAGDQKGAFYHLAPRPHEPETSAPFPKRLSETGLFTSTAGYQVAPGLIPYKPVAPLWSDNADKDRWIALPEGGGITMTDRWGWDFPNETVLMKSFSFDTTAGDPSTKKWVETRIMLKRDNEWVGYSYAWNDQQTDAFLVEAAGHDIELPIREGGRTEKLTWHYPSRTECMVCHTRAANFVLGISTGELNSTHDYGDGRQRNQLETLEALGVLRTSALPHAARSNRLLPKPASEYPALVNPYDPHADLQSRAKSYLHSNCSYCHTEAGGGNAQIDLAYEVPLDKMKAIDIAPLHHTFGIEDARIIAPGVPQRSVLLHRVGMRGAGQMPQLGTHRVDRAAAEMLGQWIESLKPPAAE